MKKTLLFLAASMLLSTALVSCGGGTEESKSLSSEDVTLSGEDSKLLEVVGDSVKVLLVNSNPEEKEGWEIQAIVELKGTTPWSEVPETDDTQLSYYEPKFDYTYVHATFVDANGSTIYTAELKGDEGALLKNAPNSTVKFTCGLFDAPNAISFGVYGYGKDDSKTYKDAKAIFDKIQGVTIEEIKLVKVERSTSSESSSIEGIDDDDDDDDDDYSSSSSSSEDWDALLNSYEQYVDKYISLMKKAAKGDMSAMSEYPSLLDKAEEFSDKMEKAQGSMSTSQWSRYTKITNKMTQAAMNM